MPSQLDDPEVYIEFGKRYIDLPRDAMKSAFVRHVGCPCPGPIPERIGWYTFDLSCPFHEIK
jgi:hypothetical protein